MNGGGSRTARLDHPNRPAYRRTRTAMTDAEAQAMIAELEREPSRMPMYLGTVQLFIAACLGRIIELAKSGEDDEHRMRFVALEYRARLVLDRWRKQAQN